MITPATTTNSAFSATNAPDPTQNPAAGQARAQANADFENFLNLLTAQLRNQDPLSPLDSTQFVAQLASFSTVEQLVKANERLDALAGGARTDKLLELSGWIGKQVETDEAPAAYAGAPVEYRIAPRADANRAELVVRDMNGAQMDRVAIANTGAIQSWDGATTGGAAAAGDYVLSVEFFDGQHHLATERASVFRTVAEIRDDNGALIVGLDGGYAVAPDQVSAIRN
ncbi:MAG: flagellar hook capping FlgD N-terminal domain-containing protein [Parvularculaceae bacterium]